MPIGPPKPCASPGCKTLVKGRARCEKCTHALEWERGHAYQRGYNRRWQKAREIFLSHHPLCAQCQKEGRITPARVVDHIIPHRGNDQLFWDESNWQSLCDYTSPYNCHGKKIAEGQ